MYTLLIHTVNNIYTLMKNIYILPHFLTDLNIKTFRFQFRQNVYKFNFY